MPAFPLKLVLGSDKQLTQMKPFNLMTERRARDKENADPLAKQMSEMAIEPKRTKRKEWTLS